MLNVAQYLLDFIMYMLATIWLFSRRTNVAIHHHSNATHVRIAYNHLRFGNACVSTVVLYASVTYYAAAVRSPYGSAVYGL